ncbi:UNVERIFIED_CONTAM: hypothetical protein FKN15_016715 [Acipenser sinensis]
MDRPDRVKDRISERLRIAGSLLFILLFFILTAVLVKVSMDPGVFFSVTMATIWFINSFGAVVQGSLFGLVGLLPQKYSTVFMSGQGLAGTFAALAMLLALSSGTDSETAALGYFITPCVGTLVSVASYLLLPQLEFAQFYLNKSNQKKNYELESNDTLLNKGWSSRRMQRRLGLSWRSSWLWGCRWGPLCPSLCERWCERDP